MLPNIDEMWAKKVDLPDFIGTNFVCWIAVAEKFFEDNPIQPCDKLQWAFMSMEDEEAMFWFYFWCQENPETDWKSFSMAMIRKFGAHIDHSANKMMLQNQDSEEKWLKPTEVTDELVLEKTMDNGE